MEAIAIASLIISVVAILMAGAALPTALQMFYGKPKLVLSMGVEVRDWGKVLSCRMMNPLVTNRCLRCLGVEKTIIPEARPVFTIWDDHTQEEIFSDHKPDLRNEKGDIILEGNIPPSSSYRWFSIVTWRNQQSNAAIAREPAIVLHPGKYRVTIHIVGTQSRSTTRVLMVGDSADDLRWMGN